MDLYFVYGVFNRLVMEDSTPGVGGETRLYRLWKLCFICIHTENLYLQEHEGGGPLSLARYLLNNRI